MIEVAKLGGPEVLRIVEASSAPVPDGHVRVKVAAIGINYLDVYERTGAYPRELPYVPGDEGAGTVVDTGQRVCWQGVPGSYAEEVVVPEWKLIPVPEGITDAQAAALPTQGLTAHYLATSSYAVRQGDVIVVHAGAGGTGLLLTQVAKVLGAKVITTVSIPEKAKLSLEAGADLAVPYEDLASAVQAETAGEGAAAVYDSVGQATFEESLRSLARRGTLVLFGQSSGAVPPLDLRRLAKAGSLTVTRPTLRDFVATEAELRKRSAELFSWVLDGKVNPHLGQTYPLADAARAHADIESRRTVGKLLLIP